MSRPPETQSTLTVSPEATVTTGANAESKKPQWQLLGRHATVWCSLILFLPGPLFRRRAGFVGVGCHLHFDDLVGVADHAVARLVALLDLVDVFHARGHFAPHGVLAVERRG